jgi:peroxiredoxin
MFRKFFLVIGIILLAIQPGLAEGGLEIGSVPPALNLGGFSLSNYLNKDVVLLSFFASWSKPCQAETELLNELHKTYSAKGLTVIGISFDKNQETLKTYLNDNQIKYTVLSDKKLKTLKDYQVLILPTLIVIDRQGKITNIYVDFDDNVKEAVSGEVRKLLEPHS